MIITFIYNCWSSFIEWVSNLFNCFEPIPITASAKICI